MGILSEISKMYDFIAMYDLEKEISTFQNVSET